MEKKVNVFNNGNQKRDFTYIDDIVDGIYASVLNFHKIEGAEIFNVGYGSPTHLMDFISLVEKYTCYPIKKNYVEAQSGDVMYTFADTTKFEKFVNFNPKIDIENGIYSFIEWLKNYNCI